MTLLESLQPDVGYVSLFNAIVRDVWRSEEADVHQQRLRLERDLRDNADRQRQRDSAFIYEKRVDSATYDRERDRLRESAALLEIELSEVRLQQLDVEDLLAYAQHALTNGARIWIDASVEQKQRLQVALFPSGLAFDGREFGTAVTCLAFSCLRRESNYDLEVASPGGVRDTYQPGHGETYELPLRGTVRRAA